MSSKFCVAWLYILTFGIYTTLLASNGLLSLRLVALYRRQRLVIWFIGGFYFVTYAATLGLIIDGIPPVGSTLKLLLNPISDHSSTPNSMFYSKTVNMCSPTVTTKTLKAVFYAPAGFEIFLFGLTAWSVLADSSLIMAAGGISSTPFLTVFYRDGILCFLVTVALRIWNIWIYLTQHVSTYNMGTQLMWAANVVLITRVYMNLVWLARGPKPTDTHMGFSTDSNEIQTRGTTNIFRMRRQTQQPTTSFGIDTSEIGTRYPGEVPDFQILSSTDEVATTPRKPDLEGA